MLRTLDWFQSQLTVISTTPTGTSPVMSHGIHRCQRPPQLVHSWASQGGGLLYKTVVLQDPLHWTIPIFYRYKLRIKKDQV